MNEEITESAKAVQEVAKTTGQAIGLVQKIGTFFSQVMNESIEAVCGMLSDTLKFKRLERQLQLIEKAKRLMAEKKVENNFSPIQPKLALPIFHYASLEDDEFLHDLWVKLLVVSMDATHPKTRTAFIDIIKQLEPIDVKILDSMNNLYQKKVEQSSLLRKKPPTYVRILKRDILETLDVSEENYWSAVDNICRLGLAASSIEQDMIDTQDDSYDVVTSHGGYNALCITALGREFIIICKY